MLAYRLLQAQRQPESQDVSEPHAGPDSEETATMQTQKETTTQSQTVIAPKQAVDEFLTKISG
ncbi:hypothetical protein RFM26_28310 [Mesorhizobium sp. VK23B]|uniref:Uncharacterized protein n=1 Tax=Mesorhizobium dulcispinae TaxID=3072316 RepID=A0ABU4XMK5_9HYPH|nr:MULTISPECIES: hypothetical protein [unclassified Mesorhizobium]MDX8469605.1 hypothetical protein [Mesorhizobium sp. VK23B]MDX8475978.1 hypothetical protein [Mesorhizobium sp. VK23A]